MSRGVRVLGAESGAEGVHVSKRAGVRLHVELPRHRETRGAAEEILKNEIKRRERGRRDRELTERERKEGRKSWDDK